MLLRYPDMLLFSKELGRYPYLYRLYFCEVESLATDRPVIHRFTVSTRKAFHQAKLGGVYTLTANKIRIRSMENTDTLTLTDEQYYLLTDTRDLVFLDDKQAKDLALTADDYSPEEHYYTWANTKALLEYNPSFWHKLLVALVKIALYTLSILIPFILYLLFLYVFVSVLPLDLTTKGRAFVMPVLAIFSVPFVLWVMQGIYLMCEAFLLNLDYFRYDMLRSYCLKWGGMRKNCHIEKKERVSFLKSGAVTGGLLVIGLVLAFILL